MPRINADALDMQEQVIRTNKVQKTHKGGRTMSWSVLVAVGFVRVVTNTRIYPLPTPLPTALAVIDQLVAHPRCRVVAPSSQHWRQVADLCRSTGASGKLVADAQHAAIAIAEGCTWVTRDADFGAFAPHGLRWEHLALS